MSPPSPPSSSSARSEVLKNGYVAKRSSHLREQERSGAELALSIRANYSKVQVQATVGHYRYRLAVAHGKIRTSCSSPILVNVPRSAFTTLSTCNLCLYPTSPSKDGRVYCRTVETLHTDDNCMRASTEKSLRFGRGKECAFNARRHPLLAGVFFSRD